MIKPQGAFALFILGFAAFVAWVIGPPDPLGSAAVLASPAIKAGPSASPTVVPKPSPSASLSPAVFIDVPYTSQAADGVWDELGEHACEEASILMAQWFAQGKTGIATDKNANRIPVATARKTLEDMVAWENQRFGYNRDLTIKETLQTLQEYLGVKNARLTTDISATSLKRELAKGNVIVLPMAGRLLNNPHFTPPGPPYHQLLVKGYNSEGFITNDPGLVTKGENWNYPDSVLINAVHDWIGSEDTIQQGPKIGIIISKN